MSIDYEKSFKKLVEQIRLELQWSDEEVNKYSDDYSDMKKRLRINRALTDKEYLEEMKKNRYFIGMRSAYRSIEELAEKLEKGEFDFGD